MMSHIQNPWVSLTPSTLLAPVVLVLCLLVVTSLYTNVRYRLSLWQTQASTGRTSTPVKIPYTIPVLGSALDFLNTKPGAFWVNLLKYHSHELGSCTLKLGGNNVHVLFDPRAIQALFKAREPARHKLNLDIGSKAFGVERSQAKRYYADDWPAQEKFGGRTPLGEQERIWTNTLLRADRVNELTSKFMEILQQNLVAGTEGGTEEMVVNLYAWLRGRLFRASTIAFYGATFLEDYPDLEHDFFTFEQNFLTIYFGIPRWLSPNIYAVREKLQRKMTVWHEKNLERNEGQVVDPETVEWEPIQGSRANRARQLYYAAQDLNTRSRAIFDLGFLFGISSNAIPLTGWMLMHILDPHGDKTLYGRVTEAINASKRPDGTIDVSLLTTNPLLLSILHESLRLYVDFLVTREIPRDLVVPVGTNGNKLLLRKDSIVVVPTWTEQRDETYWSTPDAGTFHAERFLTLDPETGKHVFSTSGTAGKFFPFGSGKTMCPGRVFAKQEVLGSVAMLLSELEFEVLGYVDKAGNPSDRFPGLADAYPGGVTLPMDGDFKVRIKRRNPA